MNITAVDVGYSHVKAEAANGRTTVFPSVVGLVPREAGFTVGTNSPNKAVVTSAAGQRMVGAEALTYSSYVNSRRDSEWVFSDDWLYLLYRALGDLHLATVETRLVLGLPIADWHDLKNDLKATITGNHTFELNGRGRQQTVTVLDSMIVPQPYGTLARFAIDDLGTVLKNDYTTGIVGVIDIGGGTVNLLAADQLFDFGEWTHSATLGLLSSAERIADAIKGDFPGIVPKGHEVVQWIADGKFPYRGTTYSLDSYVSQHISPLADTILGYVSAHWPEPGRFSKIILTGGGSLLLRDTLTPKLLDMHFPDIVYPENPRTSNVEGFLRLGKFKWRGA